MATILVIDDEAAIRTLLANTLLSVGYKVITAASGLGGLASYRQRPADLVIVDLLMPDMNGFDTIIELTREFLNVKVIAVSGMIDEYGLVNTARLLGARQTLRKPFAIDEMLNMVRYELAH